MPLIVVSYPDRITEVKTNIYVTSFGPVSDTDMVRGDIGHVFSVFNYSPTSSHWRSTPLQKMTALYFLSIPTLRTERCFFCFIFSFIAAFPPFIIASSSLSLHTQHNSEVGRVFHTAARCLFIWQLSSYKLFKMSSCYSSHAFVYPGLSCLSFWSLRPPSHHIINIPSIVEDPFSKWLNYRCNSYDVGVQCSGLWKICKLGGPQLHTDHHLCGTHHKQRIINH